MKARGSDLIEFFKSWPPGDDVYHDETPFSEDGEGVLRLVDDVGNPDGDVVEPGQKYDFDYGCLGWQGKTAEPAGFDDDFPRVFRKWVKARTTSSFGVDVPKDQVDAFKALMKERGWKVTA
jgi:hypothetical protein